MAKKIIYESINAQVAMTGNKMKNCCFNFPPENTSSTAHYDYKTIKKHPSLENFECWPDRKELLGFSAILGIPALFISHTIDLISITDFVVLHPVIGSALISIGLLIALIHIPKVIRFIFRSSIGFKLRSADNNHTISFNKVYRILDDGSVEICEAYAPCPDKDCDSLLTLRELADNNKNIQFAGICSKGSYDHAYQFNGSTNAGSKIDGLEIFPKKDK